MSDTTSDALKLAQAALNSADRLIGEFDEDNRWREFDRNIALAAIDAALAEHGEIERLRAELAMANNSFGSQTADWPGLAGRIEDLKTHCREMYVAKQKAEAEREADKALMRQALAAFDSMLGRKPEAVEKVVAALRERLGDGHE